MSDEAADIAQGLGDHVTVVGLSMGGVMAGWLAQFRSDVDCTVLIAPNFGTFRLPQIFLKPSINFLLLQPNRFIWWDSNKKEHLIRPPTAYFGFYTQALGEIRRLGWSVLVAGSHKGPASRKILVVTNANDHAVNKEGIEAIVKNWRNHRTADVRQFEFHKTLKLEHDIIDPQQPHQNVSMVYPKLIELIMDMEK